MSYHDVPSNISVSNPTGVFVQESFTEYTPLTTLAIQGLVGVLSSPFDALTTWDKGDAKTVPKPVKIPVATIHVRTGSLKAWMDGEVLTSLQNTGDFPFKDTKQTKVKYQETASKGQKVLLDNGSKVIGDMGKSKGVEWKIGWRVDGIWNVFQSIIDMFTKGKTKAKFHCEVTAGYSRGGKILGIIPTSKEETYAKTFDITGEIPISQFKTDIKW